MQDAIKVFVGVPTIVGYVEASGVPFIAQFAFTSQIGYHVVKNDTITNDIQPWQYNAEPGTAPGVIYAALYSDIVNYCALMAYPTPGQKDIFCWLPTALSQIFVDVPNLA